MSDVADRRRGVWAAVFAFVLWGLMPRALAATSAVPSAVSTVLQRSSSPSPPAR